MSTSLLTLTFHLPGDLDKGGGKANLREDALFKKHGIKSGLLSEEAFGDDIPENLKEVTRKKTPASGLVRGTYSPDGYKVQQITLNRVGINAWWREPFKRRGAMASEFEQWLKPRLTSSCGCLFLAGHHAGTGGGLPVLWGPRDLDSNDPYRFFTAFAPTIEGGKPILNLVGNPYKPGGDPVWHADPFDCTAMLKDCRLIVILGCNGATKGTDWQQWASTVSGTKPIVLGWHGTHGMPKDYLGQNFSKPFWEQMEKLAHSHRKNLKQLCEAVPEDVIGAWGSALKATFKDGNRPQRSLWFSTKTRSAGAVDPSGGVWKVLSKDGNLEKIS